jgi:hypothetical protein
MSAETSKRAASGSPEPWAPAPDECLMPEPWEILLPTEEELDRVLQRFPTLTEMGLYTLEKHQRENDWRGRNGLPLIRHRRPVPITHPNVQRQTGWARACLRAIQTNIGDPFSQRLCLAYDLQHAVSRWAGEHIPMGAVIAGAFLEEGCEVEPGAGATVFICLSVTPEVHARLSTFRRGAIDYINGALACIGISTPRC